MKDCYLTILRDRETGTAAFREAAAKLSFIVASEIAQSIQKSSIEVITPLGAPALGFKPKSRIVLISVLRAGLALLPPFLNLFQDAPIGLFGIKRDEETAIPRLYYENVPPLASSDTILLLDPMLATGGTAALALSHLQKQGAGRITLVSLIASKPGIERIKGEFPSVQIYSAAVDPTLDAHKFIVPGLGDFGDRYFGT